MQKLCVGRWMLSIGLAAILAACGGQQQEKKHETHDPSISVRASVSEIPLNQNFPVEVMVSDLLPGESVQVNLFGAGSLEPSVSNLELQADSLGTAKTSLTTKVTQAGLSSLAVSIQGKSGGVASSSMNVLFEAEGNQATVKALGVPADKGKEVSMYDYYKNLPKTTNTKYYIDHERKKHDKTKADLNPPTTVILQDAKYEKADKSFTEPETIVNTILTHTGGGTPLPGELEGTSPTNPQAVKPQGWGCDVQYTPATVKFNMYLYNQSGSIVGTYSVPQGTRVDYFDDNGSWAGLAYRGTGYIGVNGTFTFNVPNCDNSSWWDYSPADIRFRVYTRNDTGINVIWKDYLGSATHTFDTQTYWDWTPSQLSANLYATPINITPSNNSGAQLVQRIFYFMNKVHKWDRSVNNNYNFNVQAIWPAIESGALAAYGSISFGGGTGWDEWVVYHEMGHEAYYRRMLGESGYNYYASLGFMPSCFNCLFHSFSTAGGEDAGMLEGWGDFYGSAFYMLQNGVQYPSFNMETRSPSWAIGPAAEGSVAGYLWDLFDSPYYYDSDNDVVQLSHINWNHNGRYQWVAQFFQNNGNVLTSLRWFWFNRIKPSLAYSDFLKHCQVLRQNQVIINVSSEFDGACP